MRATHGTGAFFALGLALAVVLATAAGALVGGAEARATMTAAQTRQTMEAYLAALVDGGAYEAYFAEDVVVTMTGVPGEIRGRAAAKTAIDALHREQFAARIEVTSVVIGEGQAAVEAVFVGTHLGEFAGIAPTGTTVEVPYAVVFELADGRIAALRIYAWAEGVVQQLQAAEAGSDWAAPPSPAAGPALLTEARLAGGRRRPGAELALGTSSAPVGRRSRRRGRPRRSGPAPGTAPPGTYVENPVIR